METGAERAGGVAYNWEIIALFIQSAIRFMHLGH